MSRFFDVTLVTYDGAPAGAADDRALAAALQELGASVRFAVWDDPELDWSASTTTVVRSTWDYFRKPAAWRAWLRATEGVTQLINPAEVIRWNMDKSYLLALSAAGIAIVPTAIVSPSDATRLSTLCAENGWDDIVIKPSMGGGAYGAKRFARDAIPLAGDAHLRGLLEIGDALVQPYQVAVEQERERSLVYIGGAYRHAFSKGAFDPGAAAGRAEERDHLPTSAEIEFGQQAIEAVGTPLTFARVDIVPSAGGPRLMELELIEPYLGFHRRPASALALARILLDDGR